MAWKMPSFMVRRDVVNSPLSSLGTINPCVTTVNRMIIILISAKVLAFANCRGLAWLFHKVTKIYLGNVPV